VLPGLNIVITVSLSESLSGVVELHPTDEEGNRRSTSAGDNFSSPADQIFAPPWPGAIYRLRAD
jgi:hypothetical protein